MKYLRCVLLAFILCFLSFVLQAQFVLTASDPQANAGNVTPNKTVTLQFSTTVDPSTAAANIIVRSNLKGLVAGTVGTSGTTVTFTPSVSYYAGDQVAVTILAGLKSTSGTSAFPASIKFTVVAGPSPVSPPLMKGIPAISNAFLSNSAAADLDKDGDIDIILANSGLAWLENDGKGQFTLHTGPPNTYVYNVQPADFDNDGDIDILASDLYSTILLFTNDGAQNFTKTSLVTAASIDTQNFDIADFDGNGTLDVVFCDNRTRKMYILNQPVIGQYSLVDLSSTFLPIKTVAADIDKDGDWDLVQISDTEVRYLLNTGGTFTPVSILTGLANLVSMNLADFDADGNTDIIIVENGGYLQLLRNDGTLHFAGTSIAKGYDFNLATVGDFDGDHDTDVCIFDDHTLKLFLNDGSANFSLAPTDPLDPGSHYTNAPFDLRTADLNGDGALDVYAIPDYGTLLFYKNTTLFEFTPFTTLPDNTFQHLTGGGSDWGDYDNDGDLDLIMVGSNPQPATFLYENQNGTMVQKPTNLPNLFNSTCDWGDYDNDGDLDLLLGGATSFADVPYGKTTSVYINTNGSFTLLPSSTQLNDSYGGLARWGDFDNDGRLDVLVISGAGSAIYKSTADGNFIKKVDLPNGFSNANVDLGDYDHDGDTDVVLSLYIGYTSVLNVYRNDGDWNFNPNVGTFPKMRGDVEFADLDNDGDLDLVAGGYLTNNDDYSYHAMLLMENKENTFVQKTNPEFFYQGTASFALGDYDLDGDVDMFGSMGTDDYETPTYLLRNNGKGEFYDQQARLPGIASTESIFLDYDNDHDLDVFTPLGMLRNNQSDKNSPPVPPTQVLDSVYNNSIYVYWNDGSDEETAAPGLSYQLYMGTASKKQDVVNSQANLSTGFRSIVHLGNAKGHSWKVTDVSAGGVYYFGVQAVDASYEGSPFSTESSTVVVGLTGPASACLNSQVSYSTSPVQNCTWNIKGGTIVSGQGTGKVNVRWDQLGKGYLGVVNSANKKNTLVINVDESPSPKISGPAAVCTNGVSYYQISDPKSFSQEWSAVGGTVINGNHDQRDSVRWTSVGQNKVRVKTFSEFKGCTAADSLTVSADVRPDAGISYAQGSFCTGEPLVFINKWPTKDWIIEGGTTTTLAQDSISVIWDVTGLHNVTVHEKSAHEFCTVDVVLPVYIYHKPDKPSLIRETDHLTALISSNQYCQWFRDDEPIAYFDHGNEASIPLTIPGTYKITVYEDYCDATSDPYDFGVITGIPTEQSEPVSVFPNPARDVLKIRISGPEAGELSFTIYDVTQEPVHQFSSSKNSYFLNLEKNIAHLAPGYYVLLIKGNGAIRQARFIKY